MNQHLPFMEKAANKAFSKKRTTAYQFAVALLCGILLHCMPAAAQSWQWGKRGGSPSNGNAVMPYETVKSIATDSHGNVYILAVFESSASPNIAGTALSGHGNRDILMAKFGCGGSLLWHKTIGGVYTDNPVAINTDPAGHVYVTGMAYAQSPSTVSFDSDTTVNNYKAFFIAQYDTTGHLNWLRQPQPDTANSLNADFYKPYDMSVDSLGNAYVFAYMGLGLVAGSSSAVTTAGPHILKYNPQGALIQLTRLQMNWTVSTSSASTILPSIRMERTPNGKYIVAGLVNLSTPAMNINGQTVTHPMFAVAFNDQGQVVWQKSKGQYSGFLGKPAVDASSNIYLTGACVDGDSIDNFKFTNTLSSAGAMPMVVKISDAGTVSWVKTASSDNAASIYGVTLKNTEAVLIGDYAGSVIWDATHQFYNAPNVLYDIALVRLDAQTGNVLGLDSLKGNSGHNDDPFSVAADKNGNVYVGGKFSSQLTVGAQTMTSAGGDYDFFIAKYGYPCNCTPPVASYTSTLSNATLSASYTGTTPVDSVRWSFGDGSSASGNSVNHTFTTAGSFNVCVTAYSQCGTDDSCKSISVSLGVNNLEALGNVHVYPNPANNFIVVEAEKELHASVLSLVGQQVLQQELNSSKNKINTAQLPAGTYILQLMDDNGQRGTMRFVVTH